MKRELELSANELERAQGLVGALPFELLFENSTAATFVADFSTAILRANPAFCEWSGYSREELEGKMYSLDFILPEDLPAIAEQTKRRIQGLDVPENFEMRAVKRNGEVQYIRIQAIVDRQNNLLIYSLINIAAEREFAEVNMRYDHLLESCGIGIVVVDLSFMIKYVNAWFTKMTGYSRDEVIDQVNGLDMLSPASAEVAINQAKLRLSGDPTYEATQEIDVIHKDGKIIHTLVMNTVVPGTENHLLVTFIDITPRKLAENQLAVRLQHEGLLTQVTSRFLDLTAANVEPRLQEALDLFRSHFGADRMSLHVFRPDQPAGHCRSSAAFDAPPSLLRDGTEAPFWTVLRDYSIGMHLRKGEPPPPGLETLHERMCAEGIHLFYALPYEAGSDHYLLSLESHRPLNWTSSDYSILDTLTVVIANVVERIGAEQSREEMQQQMWQSHKLDSIGVLAGGIAHDFNNILAAVIGNGEMARSLLAEDPAMAHECLDDLLHSSDKARELVKQILTFSRQSETGVQTRCKPVSLVEVCEDATAILNASIPTTISFITEFLVPSKSSMILGDSSQLLQVVINLCTNAYQAVETNGRISLRVELAAEQEESQLLEPGVSYVKIVVRDTGPGVPLEHVKRIFDPFFTTKKTGAGTGLGLAVVHGIVSSHGGIVTVENLPDAGAKFSAYFPVSLTAKPFASPPPSLDAPTESGDGECILVVDDDPAVLKLMTAMLSLMQYRVVVHGEAEDAVNAFRDHPGDFDLVITDITMPRMTGNDVARAIKDARPDMPVLACSGYSISGVDRSVIDGFISKPFRRADLSVAIRQALPATNLVNPCGS